MATSKAGSKKAATENYEAAIAELEQIVESIESETIGLDELSTQVQRASELIAICRAKLKQTEDDLERIMEEIEPEEED